MQCNGLLIFKNNRLTDCEEGVGQTRKQSNKANKSAKEMGKNPKSREKQARCKDTKYI